MTLMFSLQFMLFIFSSIFISRIHKKLILIYSSFSLIIKNSIFPYFVPIIKYSLVCQIQVEIYSFILEFSSLGY